MQKAYDYRVREFRNRVILAGVILAIGFILLLVQASRIDGQTYTATATWNAVTQNQNGGLLTCTVLYNVYRGTLPDGSDAKTPINPLPLSATTYADTTINLGVYYYAVSAMCTGDPTSESPKSTPPVRFSKGDVVPKAPGSLAVH